MNDQMNDVDKIVLLLLVWCAAVDDDNDNDDSWQCLSYT